MPGHSLLDKAVEKCGSRYKLAKLLGISQAHLSNINSGKRELSPNLAVLLAHIAEVDATVALKTTVVENEKDPARRKVLERALFSGAVAATLLFSVVASLLAPCPALAADKPAATYLAVDTQSVYYVNRLITWMRQLVDRINQAVNPRFALPRA